MVGNIHIILKKIHGHKQTVSKNINLKGTVGECSDEMRNMLLETGEKRSHIHIIAKSLPTLCLAVMQKAKFVNDKLGYLAEEISVERVALFFLAAHRKM